MSMNTGPIRLLLVESQAEDLARLRKLCGEVHHPALQLDTVDGGEAAIEQFSRHCHDLYLVDFHSESQETLQLFKNLRDNGLTAPILLLVEEDRKRDDLWQQANGISDCLVKSELSAPMLEKSIRHALERWRLEEKISFERRLCLAISEAPSLNDALEIALREICQKSGWTFGQAWIPSADGRHLNCNSAFFASTPRLLPFREASSGLTCARGSSLVGKAWASKEPSRLEDLARCPGFQRACAAVEVGLNTAMAVPVLAGDEVWAVFEFFEAASRRKGEEALEFAFAICREWGFLFRHKKMEETLAASEEQFRAVTTSAKEGIVSGDSSGKIVYFNSEAEKMFGYSGDEMRGRPLTLLMPERFHQAHEQGMQRFLKKKEAGILGKTIELVGRRKDGSEFPIELALSTWKSAKGTFFTGIIRDISPHKSLEHHLETARDEALQSAHMKSEFIAHMSHEIRTPLHGIIGMTGLLLNTPLDSQQKEFAASAHSCAESLLKIVDDILDFSKIEAGKLTFETVDFNVHTVMESMTDLFAKAAQAKGIEMVSFVDTDVPTMIRGDPGRLRQILTNLVGNSVKFTEKGEIVIRVTKRSESETDVALCFSVSDTGIGISKGHEEKLFQAFFQADPSTTRKYGGAGLGLVISQKLVEMMEGRIDVESLPEKGSTFRFTAKFQKPAKIESKTVDVPIVNLDHLRVLIVDDNVTNRKILRYQLASWRMQGDTAPSGAEALRALRHAADEGDPYHLAVIDMQMPEMDGLMLARAIRADPSMSSVLLVMMTSLGKQHMTPQIREAGVEACLTKPVKQSQFYDCIVTVMAAQPETVRNRPRRAAPGKPPVNGGTDAPPDKAKRSRPMRILLVEDDLINRTVAQRQFRKLGYEVDIVDGGAEALERIKKEKYDLVFMDCEMPDMDGYAATRELRSCEGEKRHTVVIAMTAHSDGGDRKKCLAAGMDDFISKPASVENLRRIFDRWTQASLPPSIEQPSEVLKSGSAVSGVMSE